jgi:hypothetical protein
MEFYRQFKTTADAAQLQQLIILERLPELCASIDALLEQQGDQGRIYCVWGTFTVHREEIRDGVRFTLPGCPNALAWTITTAQGDITIHCTINRTEQDADFVATLHQFVEDWQTGLLRTLPQWASAAQRVQ